MLPVITFWPEQDVPALWQELAASWFEREFHTPLAQIAPFQWRGLCTAGEDLVGHVGLLTREITVGGAPLRVAGVGAVIVHPTWRGRGLGRALLREARTFMQGQTRADFGLLICEDHRLTFYTGLGWQEVPGPMAFTDWRGQPAQVSRRSILTLPLQDGVRWPGGPIDQRGLPW